MVERIDFEEEIISHPFYAALFAHNQLENIYLKRESLMIYMDELAY